MNEPTDTVITIVWYAACGLWFYMSSSRAAVQLSRRPPERWLFGVGLRRAERSPSKVMRGLVVFA